MKPIAIASEYHSAMSLKSTIKRLGLEVALLTIVSILALIAVYFFGRQNGDIQIDRISNIFAIGCGLWGAVVVAIQRVRAVQEEQLVLKPTVTSADWYTKEPVRDSSITIHLSLHHKQGERFNLQGTRLLVPSKNTGYFDSYYGVNSECDYLWSRPYGKFSKSDTHSHYIILWGSFPIHEWDKARKIKLQVLSQDEVLQELDVDALLRRYFFEVEAVAEGVPPSDPVRFGKP